MQPVIALFKLTEVGRLRAYTGLAYCGRWFREGFELDMEMTARINGWTTK